MDTELIDKERLIEKIDKIREERDNLKKRQAALRTQECRLKKLLNSINQLELDL